MRFYSENETAVQLELPVYRLHDYFSEGLIRACVQRRSFDFDIALQLEPDDISALIKVHFWQQNYIRKGLQAYMESKKGEAFGIHIDDIEEILGRKLEFFDSNVDWKALYISKPLMNGSTATAPFDVRNYRDFIDTQGNLHWYEFETFTGDPVLLFKGSAAVGQFRLMWKDLGALKLSENGTEVPSPLVFSEEEISRFKDTKHWEEEGPYYQAPPQRKDELALLMVRLANEHLRANGRKPLPADIIAAIKKAPDIEYKKSTDGMGRKILEINGDSITERAFSERLKTYFVPH